MTAVVSNIERFLFCLVGIAVLIFSASSAAQAHPLGNFTVNHFSRIEAGQTRVRIYYVVDMAEIPTFQATQEMPRNGDGSFSTAALNDYLERVTLQYADGLVMTIEGVRVPLRAVSKRISTPVGSGGLPTLRVECDFEVDIADNAAGHNRRLHFEDTNNRERIGWREIVVVPASYSTLFDSTAFGSQVTDELKSYPQNMLAAPLDERTADFSWTSGAIPSGAVALKTRDGRPAEASRDRFAELINVPVLTPMVALLGLLIAAGLGALHAFSPGHGKTVVGAYLVGSKGTARHAAFLGLTVTITHTAGVFALGMITLFASHYIVPERIFPILSFVSGAIVLVIGLTLFIRRLRSATNGSTRVHTHEAHASSVPDSHYHSHEHLGDPSVTHSHGGREHSHLPPGADGNAVTWRSLLALGISGGLLPCPSALVVLLSAIALHRVGYGLVLVVAFSMGLAATLTSIGLLFVYAGRFVKRPTGESRILRLLPAFSALVIACVGAAICYEALAQSGVHLAALFGNSSGASSASSINGATNSSLSSIGAFAVLGLGLVFGLKHATEVDHIVAVSTIVSEHRKLLRAALVGGLWGMGHTASLIVVGVIVLALRVAIPEYVSSWLEFAVALMIIGLGINALVRALRRRTDVHLHRHTHDGSLHEHLHFHEAATAHPDIDTRNQSHDVASHSHASSRVGFKPLFVGAMHGLAGSGALTVLVLTQIDSAMLGLLYLTVFGIGSILGMLLMSFLVGLPFALSARRLGSAHYGLQAIAGVLSIAFGLWYAYVTGLATGFWRAVL